MDVRVDQLFCLLTRWTDPTRIRFFLIFTDHVLRKGKGHGQGAAPLRPQKQQGMAQSVAMDQFHQMLLHRRLPDNIFEHIAKIRREALASLFYISFRCFLV